jgi:glutaminyl-peptide cyclotransferase
MKIKIIFSSLLLVAVLIGLFVYFSSKKSTIGDQAYAHTKQILSIGPRPPGSEQLNQVRAYHTQVLNTAGWQVREQKFERYTPNGTITFINLIARFPNNNDKEKIWATTPEGILAAHIDSKFDKEGIFLGADDAASACGGILAIAENLALKNPANASKIELVFFDGEEGIGKDLTPTDGLYGSKHYANILRSQSQLPRFGILLDMIGHKNLSIKIPSDSPPELRKTLFSAAKHNRVESYFGVAAGSIIDDHVPLNLAGVPTIDIIGDFSQFKWWHQPSDNIAIIDPKSLEISLSVTMKMLEDLLK